MAIRRTTSWLTLLALILAGSATAQAQQFQPFGPAGEEAEFEWFAPPEQGNFGEPAPDPNYGFFFKYERLYWNMTGPVGSDHPFDGWWGWGNRFDFGYMGDNDSGWLATYEYLDGPTASNRERTVPVTQFFQKFGTVEVLKTWRLDQGHRGGWWEPMVGVRYTYFNQTSMIETDFVNVYSKVLNNMVGPEIGLRWFRQRGRWLVSADGRFFAGFNNQAFNFYDETAFVPATEVRLQATYELFKSAYLTFGYTGTFLCDGVGQVGLGEDFSTGEIFGIDDSNAHLFTNGVNFGFCINR